MIWPVSGDSVTTELITRYQKGIIPDYFQNFIDSLTFTNGGMRYDLINFRLSQTLLRVPYVREALVSLMGRHNAFIDNACIS